MKRVILTILCLLFLYTPLGAGTNDYVLGFSPKGNSLEVILNVIKESKESILVAAYTFTSKPISEALLDAYRRGIKVKVIADHKGNSNQYTAVNFLANHGISIRLNSNYNIMHNKFMVIDGKHVQLGSFNYSASAVDKNAENVLLLRNVEEIAKRYTEEWNRLWNEGIDVKPNY